MKVVDHRRRVREWRADFIAGRLGSGVENAPGRRGEISGFMLDSSRAKAMGFAPRVPFWEGLASYVESQKEMANVR